jgi:hypothetical protein
MNKKPKLLLIGWRAYGDWLYASPSLPQLFEKYDVHLETNTKGKDLFYDDPRFLSKSYFEVGRYPKEKQLQAAEERWAELERQIKPDKTINLWQSLEVECICERFMVIDPSMMRLLISVSVNIKEM